MKKRMRGLYDLPKNINVIIEPRGYGKSYYELNKFINSKLLKDKKLLKKN